jgi:hypothetical protein
MRVLALLVVLAGCAPGPVPVTVVCLPQATYTPAEQRAMADAVEALPEGSPLVGVVVDYGKMRAANKACLESRK